MTNTILAKQSGAVVDTAGSPHAALIGLPATSFELTDSFWRPRFENNIAKTLPSQYQLLLETGRISNFQRAAGKNDLDFVGIFFNDSDLYKWLEAAAFALAAAPENTELRHMVEEAITEIADAQDENGYLNTYFSVDRVQERWTDFEKHEMYCAGHLIQAAVAHFRSTGSRRLLDVATRLADHVCDTFGPEEQGKRFAVCGHEEIEMALVELYRATGVHRYLEQARFFVDARGADFVHKHGGHAQAPYYQDHVPFRELREVIGHAVRMMYLDCSATDIYLETGETALLQAIEAQWANLTQRKMYITGGAGARWEGEAFGADYELPNETAYSETCAAIGNLMWSWRMLLATGAARFADIMELALYNGILSGLSLDGTSYFYQNPLANDGKHRRTEWFGCACCPPNVARTLASLPGYFASVSDKSLWLHLYASGRMDATLPGGDAFRLDIATDYPWDGEITITVSEAPAGLSDLRPRIPAWAKGASITINGAEYQADAQPGSYAALSRIWKAGDEIRLILPMTIRRIASHPLVEADAGRVALARGPIIYCVEQADHDGIDVRALRLPDTSALRAAKNPDLLGGIVTIHGEARFDPPDDGPNTLYRSLEAEQVASRRVEMTAIPYYAWANRDSGSMAVWLPQA